MLQSPEVRQLVGWRTRLMQGCPLGMAKLASAGTRDLRSLAPVDWLSKENVAPHHMAFRLTEKCNAACTFCCYRMSEPKSDMSNEVFFKAAQEYRDMDGRHLRLNALTGEPLLDPRFFEKMELLRSLNGFESVVMTTNAIRLSERGVIEGILDSEITRVQISTAGFDRTTYETHMGVSRYDDFLSGVTNLLRRNREAGSPLEVELCVRGRPGAIDHPDFIENVLPLLGSNGTSVEVSFLRLYTDWIGQVGVDELPEGCGMLPLMRWRVRPCGTSMNVGVLTNGDLRLCNANYGAKGGVDNLRIGNIMEGSLRDIWFSEGTRRVRRTTFGPEVNEVCRNCRLHYPVK